MSALSDLSTLEIVKRLQDKHIDGKLLPPEIRLNVVEILSHGHTRAEISHLIGMCEKTIERDIKKLRDGVVSIVKDLTVEKVGGSLRRTASFLMTRAVKAKDYKLAWQIKKELTEMLQSMGFVIRKPIETKIEITEELLMGPALIKLLGQKNDDGRTFGESWRDMYRTASPN